jgi:hypothetical protein
MGRLREKPPLTITLPDSKSMLNTDEVSVILDVTPSTLIAWRAQKKGPPYVRLNSLIRYPRAALQKWIEENTVTAGE